MKKFNYIGGILVGLALIFVFIYGGLKRTQLKGEGKYTIGITSGQNGKFIRYRFEVNEVIYEQEDQRLKFSPIINGGRYYVRYLPSDLSVSEIYWDKPVPDYITEAPIDGWKSIPSQ